LNIFQDSGEEADKLRCFKAEHVQGCLVALIAGLLFKDLALVL